MFEEQVFWKDGVDAICKGGIFYRAFDLVKFLENFLTLFGVKILIF